ncbi:hypothetical protein LXL04_018573 [Taraxacum kok-saghyz]
MYPECDTDMSDKRKRPVTGKIVTSEVQSGFPEVCTSPTTPLEFKVLSPTGIIKCEMGGNGIGIGLGIVAALEKSNECIPAKKSSFRCRKPIGNESGEECTRNWKPIEVREKVSIFDISPAKFSDGDVYKCIASDFLSSCHLCKKRLHGKDIYMYRGDKAFCSPECRSRQIGKDERLEKHCSKQASSSSSSSSNVTSPYVLATGIFAI